MTSERNLTKIMSFKEFELKMYFEEMLLDCVTAGLLKPCSIIPEGLIRDGLRKRHKRKFSDTPLPQSDLYIKSNGDLYLTDNENLLSHYVHKRIETKLYQFFQREILPPQLVINALKDKDFTIAKCIGNLFVVFPAGL